MHSLARPREDLGHLLPKQAVFGVLPTPTCPTVSCRFLPSPQHPNDYFRWGFWETGPSFRSRACAMQGQDPHSRCFWTSD